MTTRYETERPCGRHSNESSAPSCALFLDLCTLLSPSYARAALHNKGQEIHDRHYAARRRTFYASGLYWPPMPPEPPLVAP
jgi:hypothetical protein